MLDEVAEQLELARRQVEQLSVPGHFRLPEIDRDVAELVTVHRTGRRGGPAQLRLDGLRVRARNDEQQEDNKDSAHNRSVSLRPHGVFVVHHASFVSWK